MGMHIELNYLIWLDFLQISTPVYSIIKLNLGKWLINICCKKFVFETSVCVTASACISPCSRCSKKKWKIYDLYFTDTSWLCRGVLLKHVHSTYNVVGVFEWLTCNYSVPWRIDFCVSHFSFLVPSLAHPEWPTSIHLV